MLPSILYWLLGENLGFICKASEKLIIIDSIYLHLTISTLLVIRGGTRMSVLGF